MVNRRCILGICVIVCALLLIPLSLFSAQDAGPKRMCDKLGKSLVTIMRYEKGSLSPAQVGSGVFVAPNIVAANAHMVTPSGSIKMQKNLRDVPVRITRVLGVDRLLDLAFLETDITGQPIVFNEDLPKIGEMITLIASPDDCQKTIFEGMVSGFGSQKGDFYLKLTISTSARGNGGVIVDSQGRILGMSGVLSEGKSGSKENIGIPSLTIQRLFMELAATAVSKKLRVVTSDGEIIIKD